MRRRWTRFSIGLLSVFGAVLMLLPDSAWAVFEISAAPRKGGRDIRFETGLSTSTTREEELTLTIDSDQAVAYRVYTTFLSPLTNEQSRVLPQDALYVFSPSNTLGDLRLKVESPLSLGQTIVYTSNSAGEADQMNLIFHLNLPSDLPGGTYRGALSFTLEPIAPSVSLSPQTVTLNLIAESKPAFHFSVRSQKGGTKLDLGKVSRSNAKNSTTLTLQVENNTGQPYRIFQELRMPLSTDEGTPVSADVIHYRVEAAGGGKTAGEGALADTPTLFYDSGSGGAPVELQAIYQLESPDTLTAGRISGRLVFRIDSASPYAAGQIAELPVELDVDPILNLDIDIPDGLGLQFGSLKSGQEPVEKRVILKVQSNLRKPYQVSQIVARKISTPEGAPLPENSFQLTVQRAATGSVEAAGTRPVAVGETVLFISDAQGTPEELLCAYSLAVPAEAKAGPYGTEIKYSITTL